MKLLLGFGGLLGLIFVIAGPLLLFSSFNPLAQANPVVGASLRLWVSTNLTNEEAGGATNKYELFRSDRFLSIGSIPNKNFNQIGRFREVSNLDRTLFQQVIFEEVSDSTWTLSPPSQERLHDNLLRYNESKGINFVLSYEFVRDQPPDQLSTSKELPIINILEEDVEGSEEILRKLTLAAGKTILIYSLKMI